jgi:hypothetical protein
MRASLLLACAALGLPAVPAVAAGPAPTPPTECATYVLNAPAGTQRGCATLSGQSGISGSYAARQVGLTVVHGSATATVTCAGDPASSVTVSLGKPGTVSDWVAGYGNCWVTLTATSPDTTAVATNTTTYVFP